MAWRLILNLELVESASCMESIAVVCSAVSWRARCPVWSVLLLCVWRWLAFFVIVDESLPLEEVFAPSRIISNSTCFVSGSTGIQVTLVRIVLDVDLSGASLVPLTWCLRVLLSLRRHIVLEHADKANELLAADLLRVEVISFSYV